MRFGVPIADIAAGMFAAYAIVSALFHRERTGEGQYIDTTMFGGQVALLTYQAGIYFATGETPRSTGNAHAIVTPYQTFRTRDGYINIACGNDAIWTRFCRAIGLDHLLDDPRFQSNAGRMAHRDALLESIEPTLKAYATYELLAELDTPSKVVINEAIELARAYSGEEAVPFVNGVLDGVTKQLNRS